VLLILVVFMNEWVAQIPMAALVAVMIMVAIGTFSWSSVKEQRTNPKCSSIVMISTVVVAGVLHLSRSVYRRL